MSEFRFKVVLLGDAGTGKTCIINRLINGIFSDTDPTIGASFLKRSKDYGDNKVTACIWDTAGQDKFMAITSVYYRGANAAIIVYDVTNDSTFYERSMYWIGQVEENVTGCQIYLVGNKIDMVEENPSLLRVPEKEAQDFAKRKGIPHMYTSAKTGKNIKELFQQIFDSYVQKCHPEFLGKKPAAKPAQNPASTEGSKGPDGDIVTINKKSEKSHKKCVIL